MALTKVTVPLPEELLALADRVVEKINNGRRGVVLETRTELLRRATLVGLEQIARDNGVDT